MAKAYTCKYICIVSFVIIYFLWLELGGQAWEWFTGSLERLPEVAHEDFVARTRKESVPLRVEDNQGRVGGGSRLF